jgi:hypothetical protein
MITHLVSPISLYLKGSSWSWSCGSWVYNTCRSFYKGSHERSRDLMSWKLRFFFIGSITELIDWLGFLMFNAIFNNISVISWRSDLLMLETRVPGNNHQPAASHWQTLSHNVVSSTSTDIVGFYVIVVVTMSSLFAFRIFLHTKYDWWGIV